MAQIEIILHVGMGKTGTSSIQQALSQNAELLLSQGILYLGMWFDLIDPRFSGIQGQQKFYQSSPEEMEAHAIRFLERLENKSQESGASHFLVSNEEIYGQIKQITPFIAALKTRARVKLIAYARDPREWLPSAYNQWSVFHKNYTGPIRPYAEVAKRLVLVYSGFLQWGASFQDILTVRPFSKAMNVVEDFANTLNLQLDIPTQRTLERADTSEGLLRAFYNNRLSENALPSLFDRAFLGMKLSQAPSISDLVEKSFDYSETDMIVSQWPSIFDYVKMTFGIDLLSDPPPQQKQVDVQDLRNRTLEYVLHIVMHQADQIGALERTVLNLQNELARK